MIRGDQTKYNKLLDAIGGKNKTFSECVDHLISQGFTYSQANNAVHVYRKGGASKAHSVLSREERNQLLDCFGAINRAPKECVDYLRSLDYTYRQASSAVYKYRQENGLIGS